MRKAARMRDTPMAEGAPALVLTAAFFALGGLAGCVLAFHAEGGGGDALRLYLERFLSAAQAGELAPPAWPSLIWRTARWPLAAFLCGFTALGLFAVPALSALRGFFLAFSIAAFARAYGHGGIELAFLLLGVSGLVAVPVFFLLSVQSLTSARALACRREGQKRGTAFLSIHDLSRCGLCAGAVCVCVLLERVLVPALVAGAAAALS